ncbi:DUF6641 family protein [Polynucleobacter sphagniphilus]|jgi:hypothetical protein|uniref:DUF6641 family protein n=1 Tax=Polynucleobacter TaxID=44013 RepID=UPI00096BC07D|nr:DUF6641 family protein [Polynucleobacter sphagniphilus]OLY96409.1 hypothetical protein BOQ04_04515 [Polynucleobacter sphagniphilus]
MSIVTNLKLITTVKSSAVSPILLRRNKLLAKVQEQLDMCEAKRNQQPYAPKRLKTVVNKETGERTTVETIKRVKEWFWITEDGKINLAVKYGAKTLTLDKKKGCNAIELMNGTALIGTLHKLKEAVIAGEFDDAISEVSDATRKAFKK